MKIPKHIFLAGGGSEEESRGLDERFAAFLDATKPLVYVPHAMLRERHASCFRWFLSMAEPLGIRNIRMLGALSEFSPREISEISGIFMGGGNTARLREALWKSGFAKVVQDAVAKGMPVYGGSAGAIVLGADIRTAPEARGVPEYRASGLDLLGGRSIACHYTDRQEAKFRRLAVEWGRDIVAIPERAGLHFSDKRMTNCGDACVALFGKDGSFAVLDPLRSLDI